LGYPYFYNSHEPELSKQKYHYNFFVRKKVQVIALMEKKVRVIVLWKFTYEKNWNL